MGSVDVNFFAPPHTVASLKRCLARLENIDNYTRTGLFIDTSSRVPMDDADNVSILSSNGPGSVPDEPMALVVESESLLYIPAVLKSPADGTPYLGTRYCGQFLLANPSSFHLNIHLQYIIASIRNTVKFHQRDLSTGMTLHWDELMPNSSHRLTRLPP